MRLRASLLKRLRLPFLSLLVLQSPSVVAQPSATRQVNAAEPAQTGRIADLIRVWYFARLFHPELTNDQAGWEQALVETAPRAIAARDNAEFVQVVDAMLRRLPDSSTILPTQPDQTDIADPASSAPGAADAFRIVDGVVVGSCAAIGGINMVDATKAVMSHLKTLDNRGIVFDCRAFPSAQSRYPLAAGFKRWIFGFVGSHLVSAPTPPAKRERFHTGYAPEVPLGAAYRNGLTVLALDRIPASASAATARPLPAITLLLDRTSPMVWEVAGTLQAGGMARVVASEPLADAGTYVLSQPYVTAKIKVAAYVGGDGSAFRPDACVSADQAEDALSIAVAAAKGKLEIPRCPAEPATRLIEARQSLEAGDPAGVPSLGQRVLALAKLWGAVEYFFTHKALMDRPWPGALETFVPRFLQGDTRIAYEEAVRDLGLLLDDGHVGVGGTVAAADNRLGWAPPVQLRPVAETFAVTALHGPALGDRIKVGDEMVAIDGRPVGVLAKELGDTLSGSTAAAKTGRVASVLAAGPKDSIVRLTLRRGSQAPFVVEIARSVPSHVAGSRPVRSEAAWRKLTGDVGYIDLERLTVGDADRALDDLMDTRAIVFDLRGYPKGTAWVLAPRLALAGREDAIAARFRTAHYPGVVPPEWTYVAFDQRLERSTKPHYRGRIVVLIDDRAVSQSEHTALYFKAAGDPIFVGTPTAGADGELTVVALPGGLTVGFTGQDVTAPDGKRIQRRGIQPDVSAQPTLAGLRAGRDEVLEAALRVARRSLAQRQSSGQHSTAD